MAKGSGIRWKCRSGALRIFSASQVALTWLCLPLSLALTRSQRLAAHGRQILVISLGGVGDHVLVVPVLKALRSKYPHHLITLITRPHASGFQKLLSQYVDRELAFAYTARPVSRLLQPIRAMMFVHKHQLCSGTDLALIPRWEWDSWGGYFIAFFSRANSRVTFSESVNYEKQVHNWMFDSLCTHLYHAPAEQHEAKKINDLVSVHEDLQIGSVAGSLSSLKRESRPARDRLHIVIAPLAAHPRRNWPIEKWRVLLRSIGDIYPSVRFSVIGSEADRKLATTLAAEHLDATVACGLSFSDLATLVGSADLLVGADSGMAHFAGAVGIPVVQIFCHPRTAVASHYNSPSRFAAVSPRTTVIQPVPNPGCENACEADHPCCIQNVEVHSVLEAVQAELSMSYPQTVAI